jgi:hypothetical protein
VHVSRGYCTTAIKGTQHITVVHDEKPKTRKMTTLDTGKILQNLLKDGAGRGNKVFAFHHICKLAVFNGLNPFPFPRQLTTGKQLSTPGLFSEPSQLLGLRNFSYSHPPPAFLVVRSISALGKFLTCIPTP